MRKLKRNLGKLKKKNNKTNLFSNENVRKYMKNIIEKKKKQKKSKIHSQKKMSTLMHR